MSVDRATRSIAQAGGLTLRPMQTANVDMLAEWFADAEVWPRWWGHEDRPLEAEEIRGWFSLRTYEPDRFLVVEEFQTPIGYAQWHIADRAHLTASVCGFIEPASRRRGLGPRALRVLADYLLARRGFLRVETFPDRDNDPATRACEKAGFQHVPFAAVGVSERWSFPPAT